MLGVLLALYDGAEVILKPVFGTLADQVGPRPVLPGGLAAFAVFSAAFAAAGDPALAGIARFGQGAAAAAFSPAAGCLGRPAEPAGQAGAGVRRLRHVQEPGLCRRAAARRGTGHRGRATAPVHRPGRPCRRRHRMGSRDGARRSAPAEDPPDRRGPGPAAVRTRVPRPGHLPGRRYRRAGRGGQFPAGPRRRRRHRPGSDRCRGLPAGRCDRAGAAPGRPGCCPGRCWPGPGPASTPRWGSPPWPLPPRPAGSARLWAPPRSDANSAAPAARWRGPPRPRWPAACSPRPAGVRLPVAALAGQNAKRAMLRAPKMRQ
jgi:hypothetical protein